ncbi:helix-turn-helix domain-containing protein [Brevibacillus laterosporus]|uniref:helix-turn-helix domain-containing protein n=1 Tax=Brevibacillus laterosporus TaxID=1465 RepID=UPI0030BA0425
MVDLYHSGYSVKELSSEYGISEVTIYKWIKHSLSSGNLPNGIVYFLPGLIKKLKPVQKM